MGTRSNIGILEKDGSVEMVYCHWDGYPDWNGKCLLENYNSEEKARELVGCGDISSLGEKINPSDDLHSWEHPEDNVTVFYNRDRKEDWKDVLPQKYPTVDDAVDVMQEYLYLFDIHNGKWLVVSDNIDLTELTPKICKM